MSKTYSKTVTKKYELSDLVGIFKEETKSWFDTICRESTSASVSDKFSYAFDLILEEANKVTTEEELDELLSKSTRLSFQEWFDSL